MQDDNHPTDHGTPRDHGPANMGVDDSGAIDSERDLNLKALLGIGGAIVAVAVLTFISMAFVLNYFADTSREPERVVRGPLDVAPTPVVAQPTVQLPPEPRLQVNEPVDLAIIRGQWSQWLGSYGWMNQDAQVARIPIERAKAILAARGFTVRPGGNGLMITDDDLELADSSSGRKVIDDR